MKKREKEEKERERERDDTPSILSYHHINKKKNQIQKSQELPDSLNPKPRLRHSSSPTLAPHRPHKRPHHLPPPRVPLANRIRVPAPRFRTRLAVDVQTGPVHTAPYCRSFGGEDVGLVLVHDVGDGQVPVHA